MDIIAAMQAVSPLKAGAGIGLLVFIYGAVKMEFSFGILGFFLCLFTGILSELFR